MKRDIKIIKINREKNVKNIPLQTLLKGKDGKDGKDGYTPQKGIDYFDGESYILTEQDKQQIANLTENIIQPHLDSLNDELAQLDRDLVNTDNELTALSEELQEQEENINHLDDTKIDNTVNNLLNYYLKQEVYTKQEILDLIGDIEKVHLRKVEYLPEIGQENIIYLIKKPDEDFDNIYNEYIWIDNAYELLSTTQIDLSDYYTKGEIDDKTKGFATTASLLAALNNYEPKLPNSTDLMFQSVMYGGGESGYRKYRNGMLEQWGVATTQASETEFTMHQAHIDTKFSVFIEPREMGNFFHYAIPSANQKFKCRIQSRDSVSMAIKFQWRSWGRWK